jgi:glycosyltransferase involved in cell wall biosynthesis/thymidylate kinase
MRGDVLVLAIAGPDGSGKTATAHEVARLLAERHADVAMTHAYGCVICRHVHAGPASGRVRCAVASRRLVTTVHALAEVAEQRARIALAGIRARRRSRGRPTVVVDRGPFDNCVRFRGQVGPPAGAVLERAVQAVDLTVLLHAAPEEMARRDAEHPEPELRALRDRYLAEAASCRRVVAVDTTHDDVSETAARVVRAVDARRPRVVFSIFDDVDNPTYAGGGATVVARLAGLLAVDHDVTVLTAGWRSGRRARGDVQYLMLPLLRLGPRAAQLAFHALLPLAARRLRHDLWIDSFTPPFSASLVPFVTRAPVVGLAQLLSAESMSQQYKLPFVAIETLGLRRYDDVIVLNAHDGEEVRRRAPGVRVHLMPMGIDLPAVDVSLAGRGRHVLYLGRVAVHDKGLDLLVDALGSTTQVLPVLVAGTGTPRDEAWLQSLLSSCDQQQVRRVGHVSGERKHALLRDAAFLVMPSREEAFGLSALEAMSHGKPVVHFDLPALRWMEGDVRVTPFDVAELAAAMALLSEDEDRRVALGRTALAAARRHDWAQVGPAYVALVHRLLRDIAPPSPS